MVKSGAGPTPGISTHPHALFMLPARAEKGDERKKNLVLCHTFTPGRTRAVYWWRFVALPLGKPPYARTPNPLRVTELNILVLLIHLYQGAKSVLLDNLCLHNECRHELHRLRVARVGACFVVAAGSLVP